MKNKTDERSHDGVIREILKKKRLAVSGFNTSVPSIVCHRFQKAPQLHKRNKAKQRRGITSLTKRPIRVASTA